MLCIPSWKLRFSVDWRPLVEERIKNIALLEDVFIVRKTNKKKTYILGLCIVGELAGEGSVVVAVSR